MEKPSIEEPPKLELKAHPSYLWCVFLGSCETLLVIVAADLLDHKVVALLSVWYKFTKAIGVLLQT